MKKLDIKRYDQFGLIPQYTNINTEATLQALCDAVNIIQDLITNLRGDCMEGGGEARQGSGCGLNHCDHPNCHTLSDIPRFNGTERQFDGVRGGVADTRAIKFGETERLKVAIGGAGAATPTDSWFCKGCKRTVSGIHGHSIGGGAGGSSSTYDTSHYPIKMKNGVLTQTIPANLTGVSATKRFIAGVKQAQKILLGEDNDGVC